MCRRLPRRVASSTASLEVAGLLATDQWVIAYIEFVCGDLSEEVLPIGTDDLLLLAVGSDDEVGLAEYSLECMAVIHEHIARRGA